MPLDVVVSSQDFRQRGDIRSSLHDPRRSVASSHLAPPMSTASARLPKSKWLQPCVAGQARHPRKMIMSTNVLKCGFEECDAIAPHLSSIATHPTGKTRASLRVGERSNDRVARALLYPRPRRAADSSMRVVTQRHVAWPAPSLGARVRRGTAGHADHRRIEDLLTRTLAAFEANDQGDIQRLCAPYAWPKSTSPNTTDHRSWAPSLTRCEPSSRAKREPPCHGILATVGASLLTASTSRAHRVPPEAE